MMLWMPNWIYTCGRTRPTQRSGGWTSRITMLGQVVVRRWCQNVAELHAMSRAYVAFGLANPELYEVMFQLHPERMERFPADDYRRDYRHALRDLLGTRHATIELI